MNHQLNFAIAQSHQHDLRRRAHAARLAAEVRPPRRLGRVRFTMPRVAVGRWVGTVRSTSTPA
jgi:hypothetical protein